MGKFWFALLFVFGIVNMTLAQEVTRAASVEDGSSQGVMPGELTLETNFWGKQIHLNDKKLHFADAAILMQDTPLALQELKGHYNDLRTGNFLLESGVLLQWLAYGSTENLDVRHGMQYVSLGVIASSLVFFIMQDNHLKNSVRIYNEEVKSGASSAPKVTFDVSANGARVSMEF